MQTGKYIKYMILLCTAASMLIVYTILMHHTLESKNNQKEHGTQLVYENSVLKIHNVEDYLKFAESISENDYKNWEVLLCADLDFSKYTHMTPIGYRSDTMDSVTFHGVFNGNGHKITGLSIYMKDQGAGMFARLGGTVKNLWLDNCVFSGKKSGTVAAEMVGGSILNCYLNSVVEGEKAGAIVAVLDGNIENCVASSDEFYASIRKGEVNNCFSMDGYNDSVLNSYLMYLKVSYEDADWNSWKSVEDGQGLKEKKATFLDEITASLFVGGRDIKLNAYYSFANQKWCVVLPANYSEKEVQLEIKTSADQLFSMTRLSAEQEIYCIQEDIVYPISFLCADNIDTLYITLAKERNLSYVHDNKLEEIPGVLTIIEKNGEISYASIQGFYGHGNDSWLADKKSYNLKFDSYVDLLGMGANEDFALLAGYRRNSLMSYVTTAELAKEVEFEFAQEFRLVNLYVAGEYAGIYFLAEKNKIAQNRIDITNIYENTEAVNARPLETFGYQYQYDEEMDVEQHFYDISKNPEDTTGGYLLEIDIEDYGLMDSRFVSKNGVGIVLKRARFSSKEQVEYISEFWQEFEDALLSADGKNSKGKHYTEYIDLESFAMQWLLYELAQEISLNSSIYYYKESDITGDGLIHACPPWDVESSYILDEVSDGLWLTGAKEKTLNGYWKAFYLHEDFRQAVSQVWIEKFRPALKMMLNEEPIVNEKGTKNLSWYKYNTVELHKLENSRWKFAYPWNRINEIEEFLLIRIGALDKILGDAI